MIPFAKPIIDEDDVNAVVAVLRSKLLALGPKSIEFEQQIAEYLGTRHAIAISSGTAGLHLSVVASGIKPGSEVITSPLSFVPSTNCLLYENIKPVFVDIELDTLGPDPDAIGDALTDNTQGILFIDLFHQPVNVDPIIELASKHHLVLIEDACEVLGAEYKHRQSGTLGDIGVFGFYPNKQITSGEGGMIVTDNDEWAARCRALRNQGRTPKDTWLTHSQIGFNYRLDEMSAALGLSQFKRLDKFIQMRSDVANYYKKHLSSIEGVNLPKIASTTTRVSWFTYTIQLDPKLDRRSVMEELAKRGIPTRDYFNCIHLQPAYQDLFGFSKGQFPKAEQFSQQNISLPFFPEMTEEEVGQVAHALAEVINRCLPIHSK